MKLTNRFELEDFFAGMRAATPTVLGYLSLGIACGMVSSTIGLTVWEMAFMSVVVYSGSGQFIICGLLGTGVSLVDIALTVFLINLRYLLLGLHSSTLFQKASLLENIGIGALLTDESFGVLQGYHLHHETIPLSWMYGNNMASYLSWCLATVVGNLLGGILPAPEVFGLDFALTGMFIGIFVSQYFAMKMTESIRKIGAILWTVAVSFIGLTVVVSQSLAMLIATILGCCMGVILDDK